MTSSSQPLECLSLEQEHQYKIFNAARSCFSTLSAPFVYGRKNHLRKQKMNVYLLCGQVGRPVVFGLAAKGEEGARKVIEMLKSELELTMALNGCRSLEGISRAHVQTFRDRLRSML